MKGPNPYQGQNLNNQTAGAFTGALGVANDQLGMGGQALGAGATAMGKAADLYNTAGGYTPTDVTAGQLSSTNLSPYMNPFQQGVIDTTMSEMNRQNALGLKGVDDNAMTSRAFGGDRQGVERAEMRRNMDQQRANTLAQLNLANFNNAQQMGTGDINRRFAADQGNQTMRQGMYGLGAGGLAGLGQNMLSSGMSWYDPAKLSALAGQGFGFADSIAKNNIQAGTLQQQQMQALIDAAKMQWEQFANQPFKGLAAISGGYQPLGPKSSESKGALGILGDTVKAVGAMGMGGA